MSVTQQQYPNSDDAPLTEAELSSIRARWQQYTISGVHWPVTPDEVVGAARMGWFEFSGCDLSGADFADVYLSNCIFEDAHFSGARFDGAYLYKCNFRGAYMVNATFIEARVEESNFTDALLSNVNFQSANLHSVTFDHARFYATNLINASLSNSSFVMTNLRSAKFNTYGPQLIRANLTRAQLPDGLFYASAQASGMSSRYDALYGYVDKVGGQPELVLAAGCQRGSPASMKQRVLDVYTDSSPYLSAIEFIVSAYAAFKANQEAASTLEESI
jgi:uncharacterized protein YjbI with pentapeptide repeats